MKLAEQTVVEADKLAAGINEQARQEAQEEGARLISASKQTAEEQAQRLLERAKREAFEQTGEIVAGAERDAREIIEKAHKEALGITQVARDKLASVESEAKLEAEYIARRFTLSEIDSALVALKEAAERELSTRMRSHYIGKHLYQSVHFIPAFETLIKQVERGLSIEDIELPPLPELDSGEQDGTSNES